MTAPTYCPCPMCSVFSSLERVSPGALGHLAAAAAELAAAARTLLEAVERPARPSTIERIPVG